MIKQLLIRFLLLIRFVYNTIKQRFAKPIVQQIPEKTYEEIEKTGHLYVIQTDGGKKVGKTKDGVSKRIKGLQTGNVNDIEIIFDFKTSNADLLEKCVHYIFVKE